ncbi:hypothetical protein [Actinomadura sp. WMMB 499]|nr:hypothetical protein [Actinomadura sp. WMMB 499]
MTPSWSEWPEYAMGHIAVAARLGDPGGGTWSGKLAKAIEDPFEQVDVVG